MTISFRLPYRTVWGEELKIITENGTIGMRYTPGDIWTAEIAAELTGGGNTRETGSHLTDRVAVLKAGGSYHYECWKDGRLERREWKDHILPDLEARGDAAQERRSELTATEEAVIRSAGHITLDDRWMDIPEAAPMYTSAFSGKVFSLSSESDSRHRDETPEEMFSRGWKCAGTAVPVFSLRTNDSFGVGDFHDLKKLVEWASATGQRVIQLLPVNDTTMTGTWRDSYPYSANSIYALHPQFMYLPEAGVRRDSAYKALKAELEALPETDYERVNREKDRLLRKAFRTRWKKTAESEDFLKFMKENRFWLDAYCAYRILLQKTGTADSSKWGKYAKFDSKKTAALLRENKEEAEYHEFVQYHLHRQLLDARNFARERGIVLKGDLPIGVSRNSVDAWQAPEQFNMGSQAGAPPDAFAEDGQTWGFPTYDWDKMAEDRFAWWKSRLKNMEQYFDMFRIDHILGFFRIWEVPAGADSGLLGQFYPALPYSTDELAEKGFDLGTGLYTGPGKDTLFLEDTRRKGFWHPRIAAWNTETYKALPENLKAVFDKLHEDFFYRRHDSFWKESAMRKLPELLASTDMLACGEDLGMIPGCVPEVMDRLRILSLEIQRMPKEYGAAFADTRKYPYLSVCSTSTHDMSPLRAWWQEDRATTQRFWNEVLGMDGDAPQQCTPEICGSIIMMHLKSASMLAILPLQDYLSLAPKFCFDKPERERINVPANPDNYWRFRMKTTLESIIEDEFTPLLKALIRDCGRE